MAPISAELMSLGGKPISPDAPSGQSWRDEPEFEALQFELRKLELPDGQQPEWPEVVKTAALILGEKSKDLLPACYLCLGLFHTEGYPGLAAGLNILKDLVTGYWESLFPELKRMRGRMAALEWLAERGEKEVSGRRPSPSDLETVKQCAERTGEIHEFLTSKVESGGDVLLPLRSALNEAMDFAESAAPPPPPPSPAPAPSSAPSEIGSEEDASRALTILKDLGRKLGEFHRAADPTNPLGYRLPRMTAWLHLRNLPPNSDGATQIPPPPAEISVRIEEALEKGQWAGVLEQTESRFPTAILWLDLHRYAAAALEGMGENGSAAAQAIRDEVGQLLARLPGLETLRFQDGRPLANPETRAWIQNRVRRAAAPAGEAPEGGAAPAVAAEGGTPLARDLESLASTREQARRLWKQKKLPEGLRLLEEGAAGCRTFRGRLAWKLETACLCRDAGHAEAALAQFQMLDEEVRSATSEDWDPGLSLEIVKNLFQSHQKTVSSSHPHPAEELDRSRELLARLCRLDVLTAIALERKR